MSALCWELHLTKPETNIRVGEPRAGYLETPALDPLSHGKQIAYVSIEKSQRLMKYGPAHKVNELKTLVRETLADPDRCFPYRGDEFPGTATRVPQPMPSATMEQGRYRLWA